MYQQSCFHTRALPGYVILEEQPVEPGNEAAYHSQSCSSVEPGNEARYNCALKPLSPGLIPSLVTEWRLGTSLHPIPSPE